jgi:signal transduction histidine kinase
MSSADAPDTRAHSQELPETQATELERLKHELTQAQSEFQDFVYTVSHDLRAPLRHIFAYTQVIEEDWPDAPPGVRGHLATIRGAAHLLTQQLEGLTQLSRIANQPLQLQAVDVAALTRSVVDVMTQRMPSRQVQWLLASDVPKVQGDTNGLQQVLTHLLDNALKFSRGRGLTTVSLTWRRVPATGPNHSDHIEISLQDNGIGFAPGQVDKLFKVFGKLHPAREFEGLGLGLVMTRKWLARMNGTIGIEGVLNGGCCVLITVPIACKEF